MGSIDQIGARFVMPIHITHGFETIGVKPPHRSIGSWFSEWDFDQSAADFDQSAAERTSRADAFYRRYVRPAHEVSGLANIISQEMRGAYAQMLKDTSRQFLFWQGREENPAWHMKQDLGRYRRSLRTPWGAVRSKWYGLAGRRLQAAARAFKDPDYGADW